MIHELSVVLVCLNLVFSMLVFIAVARRHGDRAPIVPDTNLAPGVYDRQWPLGSGELTAHGMRQLFDIGASLRDTYVGPQATNPNFLPQRFDPTLHYTRSTDLHRTMQSAQSLLYGMYIGSGPVDDLTNQSLPFQYQPMPVSTVPHLEDSTLISTDFAAANCQSYIDNWNQIYASDEWSAKQADSALFLKTVASIMNMSQVNLGWDVIKVYDLWECDRAHGYLAVNYPRVTPAIYSSLGDLAKWYWLWQNRFAVPLKRLIAGRMIADLLTALDAVVAFNNGSSLPGAGVPLRLLHYSAHDTTVMPLLVGLEIFDGTPPVYGAHVVIEMRGSSALADYSVQVSYQNQTMVLPFCGGQQSCPYQSVFRAHLKSFAVYTDDVFAALCVPLTPAPAPSGGDGARTQDVLVGCVIALSVICAALAISLCQSRRKLDALAKYAPGGEIGGASSASYLSMPTGLA